MDGFQKRTEAKKDKIIEQATYLFQEHGFSDTNIQDIAKYAGVSPVSIYNYFGNKEGVLAVVLTRHLNSLKYAIQMEKTTVQSLIDVLMTVLNMMRGFHANVEATLKDDKHHCFKPVIDDFIETQIKPVIENQYHALEMINKTITVETLYAVLAYVQTLIFHPDSVRKKEAESLKVLMLRGISL